MKKIIIAVALVIGFIGVAKAENFYCYNSQDKSHYLVNLNTSLVGTDILTVNGTNFPVKYNSHTKTYIPINGSYVFFSKADKELSVNIEGSRMHSAKCRTSKASF